MNDVTKFNPKCPGCGGRVAKNVTDTVRCRPLDREVDGVKYTGIEHKKVRCTKKSCLRRFIVSRLVGPVMPEVEVPPHEWVANLMERPSK